jgi:hypothetical protein
MANLQKNLIINFYEKNSNTFSESKNEDRKMLSSGQINIFKNINQVIPCYQEAISIIQKI